MHCATSPSGNTDGRNISRTFRPGIAREAFRTRPRVRPAQPTGCPWTEHRPHSVSSAFLPLSNSQSNDCPHYTILHVSGCGFWTMAFSSPSALSPFRSIIKQVSPMLQTSPKRSRMRGVWAIRLGKADHEDAAGTGAGRWQLGNGADWGQSAPPDGTTIERP